MEQQQFIVDQQFKEVVRIINEHQGRVANCINSEVIYSAWEIGAYISEKLKTNVWGSKIVAQLSDYIKRNDPKQRGYSKRNLYNMVDFYNTYSSEKFLTTYRNLQRKEIVQTSTAQLQVVDHQSTDNVELFVQLPTAQIPAILTLTTFTNHIEIINSCRSPEEQLFYILYSNRENLTVHELRRCIATDTFSTILNDKTALSQGIKRIYPTSGMLFRDKVVLDFLNLPDTFSEQELRNGLLEHMKQFVLELGKDFIFIGEEYPVQVGGVTFKIDLLFYHRGLQALCAVELKKVPFHPSQIGQLEFYLEALDRDVKKDNENPSIGILLCPSANKSIVEYAMNRRMSPTMITEYRRMLIPKEVLQTSLDDYYHFFVQGR